MGDEVLLLAAGNEPGNGSGKVWYTFRYAESAVNVILLGGERVSSACGLRRPSQCDKLMVNSTRYGDYVSSHTVFVPLSEGGSFYIVKITHNGSTLDSLNYTSSVRLPLTQAPTTSRCPINCTSIGIFKLRSLFYTLCATFSDTICACQLSKNLTRSDGYFLQNCHQYRFSWISGSILNQLSNIVVSSNIRQPYLFFFIRNYLYYISPIYRTWEYMSSLPSDQCSFVNQLLLEDHKLFIICANHDYSAVYNLNNGRLLAISSNRRILYYPCSSSSNVTVTLATLDSNGAANLMYASEHTRTITAFPGGVNFEFGKCIMVGGTPAFMYLDQNDGVCIFNTSSMEFAHVNNTRGCNTSVGACRWPQVFNNRYLITEDSNQDSLTVYDIKQSFECPILSLSRVPSQVVALIGDLQISQLIKTTNTVPRTSVVIAPTPASVVKMTTLISLPLITPSHPTPEPGEEFETVGTIFIAILVVVSFLIILSLTIAIIVLAVKKWRR